jgi:ankyrin repeat protein
VDPNIAEQNGNTALMGAADKGHASVVTLLLADDRVIGAPEANKVKI